MMTGIGINPISTFDWNIYNGSSGMVTPFFAVAQQFLGYLIGLVATIIVFFKNVSWAGYLSFNGTDNYTNTGEGYNVSAVVSNGRLDEALYQQYSPPFFSAAGLVSQGVGFMIIPIWFVYLFVNQWPIIRSAAVDFYKGIMHGKGNFESNNDVFSRRMKKFKEVPDWWFLVVFLVVLTLFSHLLPYFSSRYT